MLAKYANYPTWPAKVLREEKDFITVQFFGDHSTASRVDRKQVIAYSKNYQNPQLNAKQRQKLIDCEPVSKLIFVLYCCKN